MPEEPTQPSPRPENPEKPMSDGAPEPLVDTSPPMPISEPGVIAPAPFAQVYAPAPGPDEIPVAGPPPLPAQSYYPPAYPKPGAPSESPWGEQVAYRSAGTAGYRRPGVITALAVTAIIVACLSGLTSLFSGCTAVVTATNARQTAAFAKTMTPTATVTGTTPPTPVTSDGLAADQRDVVIRTLRREMRRPLSVERKRQLDAFLAEHGKVILDLDDDHPLTSQSVTSQLGQTGQEFAAAGKTGPDFFVFKSGKLPGRLLLKDDAAVYKPDDYSPNLTSSAIPPDEDSDAAVKSGFETYEADAVVNRVRELSNGRLNAAQAAALNGLLRSPAGSGYLADSSTVPGLTAQVKSAAVLGDGSVIITFNMGKLRLDPGGNVVGPIAAAPTTVPATGPAANFVMGTISVSGAACTMGIVDGALSILLAIYLLVIAILSLRPTGAPRRLFVIYALVKIACGVIGVVGFSWMTQSLSASGGTATFAQAMVTGFRGMSSAAVTICAIGLAYPVAVLLTLFLSKSARDYYKGEA